MAAILPNEQTPFKICQYSPPAIPETETWEGQFGTQERQTDCKTLHETLSRPKFRANASALLLQG